VNCFREQAEGTTLTGVQLWATSPYYIISERNQFHKDGALIRSEFDRCCVLSVGSGSDIDCSNLVTTDSQDIFRLLGGETEDETSS
jgi:hypothetical protein